MFIDGFNRYQGVGITKLLNKAVKHAGHGIFSACIAERVADNNFFNIIVAKHCLKRLEQSCPVKGAYRLGKESERIALSQSYAFCSVVDRKDSFF